MRWLSLAALVLLAPAAARADERTPPPVVVVTPPPPEPAPPEEPPERDVVVTEPLHSHGIEFMFGPAMFQPRLERTSFSGSGSINGAPASFHHTGREMGLQAPQLYGFEIGVAYERRYLALGLVGNVSMGRADQSTQLTDVYDPSSLRAYSGAIDLAGVIPFGSVSLRVGPVMGIRAFSADLTGFDLTTCHSRRGSYPCPETATTIVPFLEPRVRVDWVPGGGAGLALGAFAGVNLFDRPTIGGGILVGFRFANGSLVP